MCGQDDRLDRGYCEEPQQQSEAGIGSKILGALVWGPIVFALWVRSKFGGEIKIDG